MTRGRKRLLAAAVGGLLVAAVAVRLLWLGGDYFQPSTTETNNVATSLATTGDFANPFILGGGATAHLSPIMPWLISLVYRAAGVRSPESEVILTLCAIAFVTLSFWLAYRLFRRLGAPLAAALGGLALVALVPLQFNLETREMAVWEAPLGVIGILAALHWTLTLDARPGLRWTALLPLTGLAALLFVFSPPVGLACLALIAVLAMRRLPRREWLAIGAAGALALILFTLPWALRNQREMGRLIWTRSNGGLELAIAYNDLMLDRPDTGAAYLARLDQIQPDRPNGRAFAAMQAAGGELRYYDRLGAETRAWIAAHPAGTARLFLRHIGEYVVPPAWFFNVWQRPSVGAIGVRRVFAAAFMIVALAGLPLLIWRDRRYLYVAVAIVVLMLPYVVVQPILRYRYLTSTLALFVAADISVRLLTALWQRRRRAGSEIAPAEQA